MALPVYNTDIGIRRTGTVAPVPVRTPATAISPVPASQPKNELYQGVDGSVWAWNPFVNQWQKRQSAPSPTSPTAPQLMGTITNPIAGRPGQFVTIKNTANPTAPGIVNVPGMPAPLVIPTGRPQPGFPVLPPSAAASFNPPPAPAPVTPNPFFTPASPVANVTATTTQTTQPIAPVQDGAGTSLFPWIIGAAILLILFSRKDSSDA